MYFVSAIATNGGGFPLVDELVVFEKCNDLGRILLPLGLRLALGQIYTNPFAEVLLVCLPSIACLLCLSHSSLVVPKRHVSSDFTVGSWLRQIAEYFL